MTDYNRPIGDAITTQHTQFEPGRSQMGQFGNSGADTGADTGERHGTYEPDDSRNVTGAADAGIGAPGGSDQQTGGERWAGQQSQDDSTSGQMGEIREHMEVIGADGIHLGTVDQVEGHRIKLTKADSGMGSHEGHHHFISRGLVAGVEGDKVRLSATAANAYALEEEK